MNISSKRFNVREIGGGLAHVRDRDAPQHLHTVQMKNLPTPEAMAQINESQFDRAVSRAIFWGKQD